MTLIMVGTPGTLFREHNCIDSTVAFISSVIPYA